MSAVTAPVAQAASTTGTTLENVEVINHLLFHKAILAEDDDGSRINKYITMVQDGEHLTMHDPIDRSVALAFELVLQEHLNPWDVDLVRFSTMYLERARKEKIDLLTAGRVILLAWSVLKLQSEDLLRRTEQRKEEAQELDWGDISDHGLSDEAVDYTQRVRMSPRAPIDEKIWHKADRKVTLMELLDAFEVARKEAEQRVEITRVHEALFAERSKVARDWTKGRLHKEDPEADQAIIWGRIAQFNGEAIPLDAICNRKDADDLVMAFNSLLFLHKDRKIDVWQENFPFGEIFLRNLMALPKAPEGAA